MDENVERAIAQHLAGLNMKKKAGTPSPEKRRRDALQEGILKHMKCGICHGPMRRARFTDCMHSFCEECLDQFLRSEYRKMNLAGRARLQIRCPFCRQQMWVHSCSAADNFKANRLANDIFDVLQADDGQITDMPGHANEAEDKETENDFKMYCKKCDMVIEFSDATCVEHFKHAESLATVEQVSQDFSAQMSNFLEESGSWFLFHSTYQSCLSEMKGEGVLVFDRLEADVKVSYEEEVGKLRAARDALISELAVRKEAFSRKFDHTLEEEQELISSVSTARETAKMLLQQNNPLEIACSYKDWQSKRSGFLTDQVPSVLGERQELDAVGALYIDRNPRSKVPDDILGTLKDSVVKKQLGMVRLQASFYREEFLLYLEPYCPAIESVWNAAKELLAHYKPRVLRCWKSVTSWACSSICNATRLSIQTFRVYIVPFLVAQLFWVARKISYKQIALIMLLAVIELVVLQRFYV